MDIITGYTGTPHITAENDRDINIGIFGSKSYVLQTGTMLTAEISNNNEIKVRDGVIMHQGCAASIKKNTYDSVTINNGSQGMKRIDLLVARYEKQPETNVESLTLKVLQGTPVETSPQVPEHTEGDIQVGDTVADMPLYEVEIDGLNITEIRKVFQTMGDLESVNGNCIKVVDSKSITTNGYNYEYSILSFGDKRYAKLFGNYTIKNVNGTSFPPFVYNTITNLGLFPVNITTKIKKVLDFSLNCFNPGSGFFLIGGIKKYIATTNAYADVQFLMTNPPQNIGLEWMMVCEIE
jgi:hypothetical protein